MSSPYETELARLRQSVQVRKTARGWNLQLDNETWAELMTGLSIAIDVCDGRSATTVERDRAARLRALRSALSKADSVER